jgi:hypothetical protein
MLPGQASPWAKETRTESRKQFDLQCGAAPCGDMLGRLSPVTLLTLSQRPGVYKPGPGPFFHLFTSAYQAQKRAPKRDSIISCPYQPVSPSMRGIFLQLRPSSPSASGIRVAEASWWACRDGCVASQLRVALPYITSTGLCWLGRTVVGPAIRSSCASAFGFLLVAASRWTTVSCCQLLLLSAFSARAPALCFVPLPPCI